MLVLSVDRARKLCLEAFTLAGLPADQAAICTDCGLFASLRGLDSHGLIAVLPGVVSNLSQGRILPNPAIATIHETETTAVLKGNGAAGAVVGVRAMDLAIEKARAYGLGAVTAFNCHHYGAASFYPTRALAHRMIGLTMCNAEAVVVPYGGSLPLHGTNPVSYAIPAGEESPIVLDIATSAAATGQVVKALRRGQSIPLGWALDADGRPTTDPEAALRGVQLPFGGHKGYAIGLLVDVLTGALSGSTVGRSVDQSNITPEDGGQALLMLVIDVTRFVPFEVFATRIDQLIREVHETPPADGFSEVLVPGDLERREEERRLREGIPLYEEDWQAVMDGLERAGLPAQDLADRFGPTTA